MAHAGHCVKSLTGRLALSLSRFFNPPTVLLPLAHSTCRSFSTSRPALHSSRQTHHQTYSVSAWTARSQPRRTSRHMSGDLKNLDKARRRNLHTPSLRTSTSTINGDERYASWNASPQSWSPMPSDPPSARCTSSRSTRIKSLLLQRRVNDDPRRSLDSVPRCQKRRRRSRSVRLPFIASSPPLPLLLSAFLPLPTTHSRRTRLRIHCCDGVRSSAARELLDFASFACTSARLGLLRRTQDPSRATLSRLHLLRG
ncbi:hypothetical protein AAT19DRAFT_13572 [Rhodotorula toruloides]|uniref:Uncharacterized protein n=1 Tax=Rhodotorula toruloides TaxID=5286 RepID=A0A2T0ABZ4_RHOTO|nr:hypothetical protein AAT19DRAFT_13572 [Rhodotorula toruloides]